MTFSAGDKIKVVGVDGLNVPWLANGLTGTVLTASDEDGYIEVTMNVEDEYGQKRNFPFMEDEIENLSKPEPVKEAVEPKTTYSFADYGIRGIEHSGAFEFFHKKTEKVLLTTEFVSLDTLIRIVNDHKEGNR